MYLFIADILPCTFLLSKNMIFRFSWMEKGENRPQKGIILNELNIFKNSKNKYAYVTLEKLKKINTIVVKFWDMWHIKRINYILKNVVTIKSFKSKETNTIEHNRAIYAWRCSNVQLICECLFGTLLPSRPTFANTLFLVSQRFFYSTEYLVLL